MSLTNLELAELLARESEAQEGNKQKAARRASRVALSWPEEVTDILGRGDRLTDLPAVGPWVAVLIHDWLEDPPEDIEPASELREDFQTYAGALSLLATDPVWQEELRGDLQMHTTYSDGALGVEELARHAIHLGYEYVAITDHSKGLKIAGGMDEAVMALQWDEIDEANRTFESEGLDFRILRAIEMNLSPTGEGDMDPDALTELDLVLGSFHSQLRKTEDQTDRYLAGIRNPDVHVLGHPRGRQWNFRLGLAADWAAVFEEAGALDKAVEIDAHPNRQDLNVELLELAADAGVRISIGTDSHYAHELYFIDIGLAAALRAGISRDRILNYMGADELVEWAASVRGI